MKVQQYYQDIIESLGGKVTDAGAILNPAKDTPYQIGGLDVVIPTKVFLDANDWSAVHPFHPLCEDALMGQSETYHFLLRLWRANTTVRFSELITAILTIAADPKLTKEVKNPDFAKLPIPQAKDSTVKAWKKLRSRFAKEHFLKLYVSRSEDIDGVKYLRRADLSIPLLETEGGKPFGTQISTADADTIRGLIRHLFEPMLKPHGSNHATPYFDVLLQVQKDTAEQYNKYASMLSKVQTLPMMPVAWLEAYPDMDKFRRHIPTLPGNEGSKLETAPRNSGIEPEDDLYSQANIKVRKKDDDTPPFDPDPPRASRRHDDQKDDGRLTLSSIMRDKRELEDRDSRGYGSRRDTDRSSIDLFDRRSRRRDVEDDRDVRRSSRGRDDRRRDSRASEGSFTLRDYGI